MKLNLENTVDIGKPCNIFDADGFEVEYCIACDTETGEITRRATDENDNFIIENNKTKLITEIRPAPLKVVYI